MDYDEHAEASHYADSLAWAGKFNDVCGPPIAAWVSPSGIISLLRSLATAMGHSIGATEYGLTTGYCGWCGLLYLEGS